ncbi:hypothetical protein BC829DRAFT_449332 [Chytridium lagenaria]|nr:hypothetical protein BC829DRAFT_449332 [Chytridium lagenaria]
MVDTVDPVYQEQYDALRQYLESYLQTQKQSASQSSQRASAREKLTKLTRQQFSELATDVYDEMKRRQYNSSDAPFLSVRDDLHPKRNQARQKLATLPTSRFKDLASDVFYELERRYPTVIKVYEQKYGLAAEAPIENIDPMLDNQQVRSPNQSNKAQDFTSLDNLMADLGNMLLPKEEKAGGISIESVEKLRNEYEARIESLQGRTVQLEQELNSVRSDKIPKLEAEIANEKRINREKDSYIEQLRQDYTKLKTDYEGLQDDFNNQQQIAQDIRTEATNLLAEIKSLSKKNEELTNERDRLLDSNGMSHQHEGNGALEHQQQANEVLSKAHVSGLENSNIIPKARIASYQQAVNELLRAARPMRQNFGSIPLSLLEDSSANLTDTISELVMLLDATGRMEEAREESGTEEKYDIDDLKLFLEKQTDSIVQAIQTLLYAMRNQTGAFGEDFKQTISSITTLGEILEDLGAANVTLEQLGVSMLNSPQSKTLKQRLASSSFEIAKFVKELISLIVFLVF